jgi:4-hydroxyphenylpyruvate dioxygenase-like putative hemolysin
MFKGIQHIGLNSNNIIKTVTNSKSKKLDIQYYSTPDEYYQQVTLN